MCTHTKDNEWYIYLRNKDTMSQSLPLPGGMTQKCVLILRIMNGTSSYVTMSQSLPQPGGMTQKCVLILRIMNGTSSYVTMSQSLSQHWWNDPKMCTHTKDNEWYI